MLVPTRTPISPQHRVTGDMPGVDNSLNVSRDIQPYCWQRPLVCAAIGLILLTLVNIGVAAEKPAEISKQLDSSLRHPSFKSQRLQPIAAPKSWNPSKSRFGCPRTHPSGIVILTTMKSSGRKMHVHPGGPPSSWRSFCRDTRQSTSYRKRALPFELHSWLRTMPNSILRF